MSDILRGLGYMSELDYAQALELERLLQEVEEARALVKWILEETPPKSLSGEYNLAGLRVYSMRQALNIGCLGCKLDAVFAEEVKDE